jgi:glycosyltransferase involved in cell wall biosynthesis
MKKKSHIIFVMPQLNTGGAERVIVNIINHLNRDSFDITLVLFNSSGSLMDRVSRDIDIHNLNISSVAKGMPQLLSKIHQLKPDILFTGIGNLNLYISIFIPMMRLLLPKTKWIARQASILTLNNRQEKSPEIYDWLYKKVYKNYNKIVCQSKYMRDDLVENYNFPKSKIVVINNPLDIRDIDLLSKESVEYPFSSSKIRLISVGQLRLEKRQDLMLKAFAKLDSRYTLTLIGDGVKREELEELTRELKIDDRVAFLGYQKNPYKYIKNSNILVLTSEYEGFPNVLLEANYCGIPVVTFNSTGGVSEIIKSGLNGLLVPFEDIEAFAKAIESVNKDGYNGSVIRDITVKKYSIDLIIKKYEFILKGRDYE